MRNSGFTLIEILVVITLGAILSTAGFLSYNNYQIRRSVELSLQELGSTVEQVQRRSVTQEDGNRWSIRFTATSTGEDTYDIYRGDTYSVGSTTQSFSFKRAVHFSEPSGDRTVDFNFEPVSGKINNRKIITITNDSPSQITGDVIVNTLGVVTEKMRDDIIGYWHFDEGAGATTTDASGEGNYGGVNGVTWESASSCIAGQCLDFDGSGDYIALDMYYENGDSLQEFTVEAWYKTNVSGGSYSSNWSLLDFDRSDWFNFYVRGDDGRLGFSGSDGVNDYFDISSDTSSNDDNWHYGVVVYDSSEDNIKFYLDGELDGTHSYASLEPISDSSTRYGFIGDGSEASSFDGNRNSNYFNGSIDELRIYNRALSSSTIKDNYNDLK